MDIRKANASVLSSNICLGADSVLQLLKNYCRTDSGVRTSITVGIIGYPNVGKSSIINSLKRSRAVGVSSTAGFTRAIQVWLIDSIDVKEIQIDRNISLLDCPGIIFNNNNSSYLLRNCVDVHVIIDQLFDIIGDWRSWRYCGTYDEVSFIQFFVSPILLSDSEFLFWYSWLFW